MKLLVAGGKEYNDKKTVYEVLDWFWHHYEVTGILHGDGVPSEKIATEWAKARDVACTVYKPNYKQNGYGGKHIRNQTMLLDGKPDLAVFFPCDRDVWDERPSGKLRKRRGTDDIRKRCQRDGITMAEIVVVDGDPELRFISK